MPIEQERRAAFVQGLAPYAARWQQQSGLPAPVLIAIAAHETNYGNAGGNMLFGIKGPGMTAATHEIVNGQRVNMNDSFRTYATPDAAFADFLNLVRSGRYAPAWQQFQRDGNVANFLDGITRAGYATDQTWGSKIMSFAGSTIQPMLGSAPAAPAAPAAATGTRPPPVGAAPPAGGATVAGPTNPQPNPATAWGQRRLDEIGKELAQIQQDRASARARAATDTNYTNLGGYETDLRDLTSRENNLRNEQAGLIKTVTGAETTPVEAAAIANNTLNAQTNWQQSQTQLYNAALNGVQALWADQRDYAKAVSDLLISNATELSKWYGRQLERGGQAAQQANMIVTARLAQSNQNLARAAHTFEVSKWIDETRWRNYTRTLPAGVDYMLGFAPGDPINRVLQSFGMQPITLPLQKVSVEQLDPERTLAAAGYERPQADPRVEGDTQRLLDQYNATVNTTEPMPTPLTMGTAPGQVPLTPPDAAAFGDPLSSLPTWVVTPPPGGGAVEPPPPPDGPAIDPNTGGVADSGPYGPPNPAGSTPTSPGAIGQPAFSMWQQTPATNSGPAGALPPDLADQRAGERGGATLATGDGLPARQPVPVAGVPVVNSATGGQSLPRGATGAEPPPSPTATPTMTDYRDPRQRDRLIHSTAPATTR